MTQPIIGITTYGRHERDLANQYYSEFFFVPADYVDAVRRAGGVPMLLPPGETNWQRWLDVTDGIIVTGGSDIHPARYGGNVEHPNLTNHDLQRDETEIALVQELVTDAGKPALYICRGAQVLNVALGGTLHEHVPDVVGEDIHRSPEGFWANQPLRAEPGSQLAQVMGATEVTTTSGHHQAIKEVAAGLKVVAEAADGIIEALQVSEHPWALAVQWHPEKTAAFDPTQQALFDQLVQAARQQQIVKRRLTMPPQPEQVGNGPSSAQECQSSPPSPDAADIAKQDAPLLTKEMLTLYQSRWKLVSEMHQQELKIQTPGERWQKLNAMLCLSISLGTYEKMHNQRNVTDVRARWNRLKDHYS